MREVNVAILSDNLKLAKEISDLFRKVGVIPFIYSDVQEFWQESLKDSLHLCLIDVQTLPHVKLDLNSHPLLKSKEMDLAFLWGNHNAPLLSKTHHILNIGNICVDIEIEGQLKSLLNRLNYKEQLKAQAIKGKAYEIEGEEKISKVIGQNQALKEKNFYYSILKNIIGKFENVRDSEDFELANAQVWASVGEVFEFSVLELNQNGQKLVSPKLEYDKYRHIPSLWLGKTSNEGIAFFAQNMASQIAVEILGGELMSLLIKGKENQPEKMLFIRVRDEDFLSNFDWETLEYYLSGLHSYYQSKKISSGPRSHIMIPLYDLYGRVEKYSLGLNSFQHKWSLIGIDFSKIEDNLKEKSRFYWEQFYTDFFSSLELKIRKDFQFSLISIQKCILLIDEAIVMDILTEVKAHAKRYPVWKYFENSDDILTKDLTPEVRIVPCSRFAMNEFNKNIIQEIEVVTDNNISTSKSDKSKFWRDAPLGTM